MGWKKQAGFTLVELLVVIAIIGVLVALLLPAVQAARESARRTECSNKIRQIGLAAHNYLSSTGTFPSSAEDPHGIGGNFSQFSYLVTLLPYHEESSLHDLFDTTRPWTDPANAAAAATAVPEFKCTSQDEHQYLFDNASAYVESNLATHYFAVLGFKTRCPWNKQDVYSLIGSSSSCAERGGVATNGIMYPLSKTKPRRITDGLSNTLLVGEISWDHHGGRTWIVGTSQSGSWSYSGYNIAHPMHTAYRFTLTDGLNGSFKTAYPNNDLSFGSSHISGTHFCFGDGSVQYVSENVDLNVLRSHASRAGEEINGPF